MKNNISAKIIADSISAVNGKRITTFELEFNRFILPEFNTHRMVSKNAASSRAIPVATAIQNIRDNTAMPVHWGKNQPGMQANEECNATFKWESGNGGHGYMCGEYTREEYWRLAANNAIKIAENFAEAGYHKQIVNRITEPFQMIKVVATATEWDNFFWLRKHADAQPEIRVLAEKMWEALQASTPEKLNPGEWHTPYVKHIRRAKDGTDVGPLLYGIDDGMGSYDAITLEDALKVSSSMCAQVSYRKADDTLEKALMVYDRLVESKPVHASPFEHQATPMGLHNSNVEECYEDGVTGWNKTLGFMSGNFANWIQHRQLIKDNTCWNYTDE